MTRAILATLFRSLSKNLTFSVITLSSLIVGITTVLLLYMWVSYEVTFNKSLKDHDRIFALLFNERVEGEIHTEEGTRIPLLDFLTNEVPEVEAATRIDNKSLILAKGSRSIHKRGVFADSSFFVVHLPDDLQGEASRALSSHHSIAISNFVADELFKGQSAIGQTILVDKKTEFVVTSVFSRYPSNSDFHYIEFVLPFSARSVNADDWVSHDIKLFDPTAGARVEERINQKIAQLYPEADVKSKLFGLDDWRLRWSFENGVASGGRILYVVIFSITGLFVLVMACVNYMNISTAHATRRMREIGVRKMTGATQQNLIRQFMLESLVITSVAALVSLGLAYLLLPFFNQLVGVPLELSFNNPMLMAGLVSIVLVTSLLAGSYPAWILSSARPALVLKGASHSGTGGARFRKALVVFQFSLSVTMIFCALITWQQTDFLLKKDLGYDKHRVINVWLNEEFDGSFGNVLHKLQSHTSIESSGFSGASPMEVNGYAECNRVDAPFENPLLFYGANIDDHVLNTLNFKFVAGRNFNKDFASDSLNFIVTKSAADLLGFADPIGQRISFNMFGPQNGEIIGVIKDFQHDDIHTTIRPVVFIYGRPAFYANLFVRYNEGKLDDALQHLQTVFNEMQPGIPLDYSFLDADFERQLHKEKLLSRISITFTFIAIIIASLGLFGLVLFNAQRRTKEIGIRKVLGASVFQVTIMLYRDFVPQVACSLLLAFPASYILMQKFLEGYTDHVSISIVTFLTVTMLIFLIAVVTASHQSLKTAHQNPVDALKSE